VILLMLDFDGTLVPIQDDPFSVELDREGRRLLQELRDDGQIELAVISGRSLPDVKARIGLKDMVYAGCHGLEMEGPDWTLVQPKAQSLQPHLQRAAGELAELEASSDGNVLVEDKRYAVAVHFRRASPGQVKGVEKALAEQLRKHKGKLKLSKGRKVYELKPNVGWDKGQAARLLMRMNEKRSPFPVYVGDDLTDETAFQAIRDRGLGILVESQERSKVTAASYRMKSVRQVREFLKGLLPK
jgi:trehalose-phosphatase